MNSGVEDLLYWVSEREAIRLNKEEARPKLLAPYTGGSILQTYRFCNVRRKHDRVSRWLIKNVLTKENLDAAGLDSFIMFTALCRYINWPPTISAIKYAGLWPSKTPCWKTISQYTDDLPGKVWTGAYMIRAEGKGRRKADYVVKDIIEVGIGSALLEIKEAFKVCCREVVWSALRQISGFGSFMAGQVVDDWAWTPLLENATDHFTWAPQGPGSLRGFNRIKGLPLKTSHSTEEWCLQLQEWRQLIINRLGKEFEDMTLHDVQSCLCEVDKYLRVKNGEGRPRSLYKPETAY